MILKRDAARVDARDEGSARMDSVTSVFGNWFSSARDDGSESDDGSDEAEREAGSEKSDDARDEDGATRADEDAEARALLPPATTLHPYEDVRRSVEGLGTRRHDHDYPSGLTNGGNTCFAASALQCLRRATPLTAWFDGVEKFHDVARCAETRKFCVVCEYSQHLERAMASRDAHSIGRLTKDISKVARQFRRGRQEDSHEFINALLDAMHVIFLKDLGGEKKYDLRTRETTVIYHVFGGYTLGTVKCLECGYVSKNFQSTLDIPLEVTGKIGSVEEALRENFCTEEVLSGSNKYKCSKCKALVRAKKGSKIHVSPNILTIPLKRYSTGRFSKITKYIKYPSNFSLAEFMSDDAPYEVTAPEYELFGVLVHQDFYASAHSGHYVAYVKLRDDSWVLCNDSRVSPSSEKDAMKQKAYILFYERVHARGAPPLRPAGYLDELRAARDAERAAPAMKCEDAGEEQLTSRFDSMSVSATAVDTVSASSTRPTRSPVVVAEEVSEEPSVHMETVNVENGRELRVSVTLPGCRSARDIEVELSMGQHDVPSSLIIKAPMLYATPVKVHLPPNVEDPVKSSFVRKTSEYRVRFPVRE